MAGYYGQPPPGGQYDRYLAHNEQSTLHKFKETYWTTKQVVIKKLGKKEDEHVVASDAQLDAKLEVFKAIQTSSMDLLRGLEKYQDKLCTLSQEENGMGRFLKTMGQQDKTRAGKMMAAVGKSQSFSSQQRLALRVPLVRLYQEVETFRYRAISDTLMTINRMESSRTEYRGALLWMKDVSEELDPDTYKQLEKFRKVQAQVKKTKARFDKLKLDTMQKIDLLAASRCNMFSHVLANYQSTLLHFWEKTSRTMTAVSDSFKGYQYYEFNMLKLGMDEKAKNTENEENSDNSERGSISDLDDALLTDGIETERHEELCEPTKKLAEETGSREEAEKEEDAKDGESSEEEDEDSSELIGEASSDEDLLSLSLPSNDNQQPAGAAPFSLRSDDPFDSLPNDDPHKPLTSDLDPTSGQVQPLTPITPHTSSLLTPRTESGDLIPIPPSPLTTQSGVPATVPAADSPADAGVAADSGVHADLLELISFGEEKKEDSNKDEGSMTNLLEEIDKEIERPAKKPGTEANDFLDFGTDEDKTIEEIKKEQDLKFDLKRPAPGATKDKTTKKGKAAKVQANKDLLSDDIEPNDLEKDDMTLLNEILNAPSSGGDDFTREWQAVFGNTPLSTNVNYTPVETDQSQSDFMPSNLLDISANMANMNIGQGKAMPQQPPAGPTGKASSQQDMAASANLQHNQQLQQQQQQHKSQQSKLKKGQKTDMSAWFNLFADLDPLANPDAIGKRPEDISDA